MADVDFKFLVCVLLIYEQNNTQFRMSKSDSTYLCVFAQNTHIHWLHCNWQQYPPNTGNSGCTLALWEMPKLNIILEYNVIVYSG